MSQDSISEESIRLRVRELVCEFAPEPILSVSATDRLEDDLGYNSLELAELSVAILDEFEIEGGDPDELLDVVSVADVEALLFRQLRLSGAS